MTEAMMLGTTAVVHMTAFSLKRVTLCVLLVLLCIFLHINEPQQQLRADTPSSPSTLKTADREDAVPIRPSFASGTNREEESLLSPTAPRIQTDVVNNQSVDTTNPSSSQHATTSDEQQVDNSNDADAETVSSPLLSRRKGRAPSPLPNSTQYATLIHNNCQCKQPFTEQYETMFSSAASGKSSTSSSSSSSSSSAPQQSSSSRIFWNTELYQTKSLVKRFLKSWFDEVMSYRRKNMDERAAITPGTFPPEVRLLFVGDSLARNMFYSLIMQAVDEAVQVDDPFSAFARRVILHGGDSYQTLYVTWPTTAATTTTTTAAKPQWGKKKAANRIGGGGATNMAVIKIRYENNAYFGMDTHSLKSSRALEFNPTHVFVSRGLWDVLRVRPFDPAVPLSAMSAGLVRLRKELQEYREKLSPKQRNLYPPTRVVYWAMPKLFASWESHCNHCEYDQDQGYFRDALYAAVRRANGALLHLHGQENFDSVAIELFDYYAMSKAAGARDTLHGDCIHPTHGQRRAILAQMLDLVSQPPRSQESVQQLVDDAQANNRVFLNATMYIPPPLVVRSGSSDSSSSCPLSFTLTKIGHDHQPTPPDRHGGCLCTG